jgi:hypothetical protein
VAELEVIYCLYQVVRLLVLAHKAPQKARVVVAPRIERKGRLKVRLQAHATATNVDLRGIGKKYRCATIDMLPDDVWLDIFDSCIINGNGSNWCMYVDDGDKSYSHRHAISTSNWVANAT